MAAHTEKNTETPISWPDHDAPCPFVPFGATEWEAVEIARHWRDACQKLKDAVKVANTLAAWAVDGSTRLTWPDRFDGVGGYVLHGYAIAAELSITQMARVIDGVRHRQAQEARTAPDAEES